MKKQFILAGAIMIAAVSFGQKKELKKAEKAFVKKDVAEAVIQIDEAEKLLAGTDNDFKVDFYSAKGEIYLADAGKSNYNRMKEAAEAFMMARELDVDGNNKSNIDAGIENTRVALVNSAVGDQQSNPELAAEKLYLAFEVKKDTSDLYYAAGNMLNAKNYDKSIEYYEQLLDMGYTGIKKEYTALRIEDGEIVPFASEADRNSEMISGKYTKPSERMTESAKGDMLRSLVLIYSSQGKNDKAIKLMADARAANPDDMSLVRTEADMVYRMGDMPRYNALMQEILASDPNNPELHFNLGVAASSNDDKEKAMQYYKDAIRLQPDYPSAQINLAQLILGQEKSIVDEMNSLGMSKADEKKYDVLSAKRQGLYSEALPYLESAYNSRQDNVELVRTLMNIYSQLSMTDKFNEFKAKLATME